MRISDWSSDVCSSDLDGKTTVYEVNPGLGTARRRDDFKGVFTGASAVGKKQLPDGSDAKDFTVWEKPSIQGKRYQPKADQKQGGQPRSEERRVGKEWVSKCRSRWSRYN